MCNLEIFKERLEKLNNLQVPFPQNSHEFLTFCQQLAIENSNSALYLEIGSRHGGSLYIASGFLPIGSTIICIDLPNAAWGIPGSELKLNIICTELISEGYKVYKILSDSSSTETQKRVFEILGNNKLDALFIDGDHKLESVTADWNNYSPMVRQNGIIAFHDIVHCNDSTGVEVGQLWSKLVKSYSYLEVVFEHGIGIIWKK